MNNFDFYKRADEIRNKLSSIGLSEWTEQINDAISGGSMAGEILMALRWIFQELKRSGADLSESLLSQIDDFIEHVNRVYPIDSKSGDRTS